MIKQELVDAYIRIKKENNFTYDALVKLSGLTKSQIGLILTQDGNKISIDKMVEGLFNMGISVSIEFYREGE